MKKAILRFGYTCVFAAAAIGFTARTTPAQTMNVITVTLPADVVAGSNTLVAGKYRITDLEPASGHHLFIFRREDGKPVALEAQPLDEGSESAKTSVTLSNSGSALRLHKLEIEGSSIAWEFDASN